jgi:hypothetical protein
MGLPHADIQPRPVSNTVRGAQSGFTRDAPLEQGSSKHATMLEV